MEMKSDIKKPKPLLFYKYYSWEIRRFDLDKWAEISIRQQEKTPDSCFPIYSPYVIKLERTIYPSEEKEFTEKEHKENIDFLKKLQEDLYYVWSHRQREESGMGHLVKDYKTYYQIEEEYKLNQN